MQVRRATHEDQDVIVETLVASHLDYGWEVWAVPGPHRRERLTELVRHHVALIALPCREVWMTDDGAAIALWQAEPGAPPPATASARIAEVARAVYGERLAVIESVDAALLPHRPREAHRFLGSMGVRPEQQRRGLGTAVLRPVLEELDRNGEPACLETSSAGNVAFYGRLGFTVLAHVDDLPAGAPETWVLWRVPEGSAGAGRV